MKTFCLTTLIGISLLICANRMHAQSTPKQLHQIELMKQFSGRWKVDLVKDTFYPKKLKISDRDQFKSAMAGIQKIDSVIMEVWDTVTSQLVGDFKYVHTYDAYGNETYIESRWDKSTSQWIRFFKNEYVYDANGNETLGNFYDWEKTTSHWAYSGKEELAYDGKGNITLRNSYFWDGKQWVISWKGEYVYDGNWNIILSIGTPGTIPQAS
jgi:hypothetical protein